MAMMISTSSAQALEHADLGVGLEPGQHARGMVVVEQLAAEFQIELAAELIDAVADMLGLKRDVLVVDRTRCAWNPSSSSNRSALALM